MKTECRKCNKKNCIMITKHSKNRLITYEQENLVSK